ncbi:MAG: cytochrome c-type biogenesis protein CcmH [Acidimicrobiales bacterium]|nr:cytochrome c-type biogenesis protein CcmH [Acidimicrobiales bacterium]
MKTRLWVSWLCVMIVACSSLLVAAVAQDPPATEAQRAYEIKATILCPVCDGQNVLESNAPVATAIRAQVDELVEQGRSDEEIRAWMARQYGSDVNAIPPRTGIASLVWIVPVFVAVVSIGALVFAFVRWRAGRELEVSDEDLRIVRALREKK